MYGTRKERFLKAVQRSYARFVDTSPRSNEKIKVLHGWVIKELRAVLGERYTIKGLTEAGGKEQRVDGKYYQKQVDVAISREDNTLGVVSIKFVMSNYQQNKNNYFEQQLGETANLRRGNIVYGYIMLIPQPTPYLKRGGEVKKYEDVDDRTIDLYMRLGEDHGQPHVPDVQCIALFLLTEHKGEIRRQCTREDLPDLSPANFENLVGRLSIDHFFESMESLIKSKYIQTRGSPAHSSHFPI